MVLSGNAHRSEVDESVERGLELPTMAVSGHVCSASYAQEMPAATTTSSLAADVA